MREKREYFNKVTNNNIMLIVVGILVIVTLSICILKNVKADSYKNNNKSYITIEIHPEDTLTSIAENYALSEDDYSDYMNEVMFINNLKDDTIHAGCYLIVPNYNY